MAFVLTFSDSHGAEMAETLAIEKPNDVAFPVLREGTPVPAEYTEKFLVDGGQRTFQLRLLAGASKTASGCRTLLELSVPLEHPLPTAKGLVQLKLEVKDDGKLVVHTEELGARRVTQAKPVEVSVRPWDGTRNPDPSDGARQRKLRLWRRLPLLVLLTYFAYVVASDIDESGLGGWIETLSMRWFGVSYDILNILLLWALYFPCKALLVRGFSAALPGVAASLARIPAPAPRPPKVKRQVDVGPGGCALLVAMFGVCALLVLGALAGAIALAVSASQPRERPSAPALDLDALSGTLSPSPHVILRGWFHEQLAARYTSFVSWPHSTRNGSSDVLTQTDYSFTPVTPLHWKPGEPVSILFQDFEQKDFRHQTMLGRSVHWRPGGDPSSVVPGAEGVALAPSERTLHTRLVKNDLPAFIEDAYERAGLHLSHPYWVAYAGEDFTLPTVALIITLVVCIGGLALVMTRFLRRRLRAQARKDGKRLA